MVTVAKELQSIHSTIDQNVLFEVLIIVKVVSLSYDISGAERVIVTGAASFAALLLQDSPTAYLSNLGLCFSIRGMILSIMIVLKSFCSTSKVKSR